MLELIVAAHPNIDINRQHYCEADRDNPREVDNISHWNKDEKPGKIIK